MDTVLLDPPLVALDKDAPVPYAGKKCKCKITNTLISAVQQTAHVLIECSMFIYTHSTQSVSHTHTHKQRRLWRGCFSAVCRQLWQLHTPRQKQMIHQFSVLTVCHGDWIPFITVSSLKQMAFFLKRKIFFLPLCRITLHGPKKSKKSKSFLSF